MKESFRQFWKYRSPTWAGAYLDEWIAAAKKTRLEPMKKVAGMLERHQDLLLNYFRAKKLYTSAAVEGLNHKARGGLSRSYGHRGFAVLQLALYHSLGELPEPKFTHDY